MGRNPLSNKPKTDKPLRIRLTDDERELLDNAANIGGLPTSSWAREVLIKFANRLVKRST